VRWRGQPEEFVLTPKLEKMAGDALKIATVKRALTGVDVVIQSLGVAAGLEAILKPTRFFSKATRVPVTAMEKTADRVDYWIRWRVVPCRAQARVNPALHRRVGLTAIGQCLKDQLRRRHDSHAGASRCARRATRNAGIVSPLSMNPGGRLEP
jgi:hypothetical protein